VGTGNAFNPANVEIISILYCICLLNLSAMELVVNDMSEISIFKPNSMELIRNSSYLIFVDHIYFHYFSGKFLFLLKL